MMAGELDEHCRQKQRDQHAEGAGWLRSWASWRFDGTYDIAADGDVPKPEPEAFKRFLAFYEFNTGRRSRPCWMKYAVQRCTADLTRFLNEVAASRDLFINSAAVLFPRRSG